MAETFAERLTQIRKSKKLSQSELADRIDVKTAAICHFEKGHRKPTFEHLLKLAEVLGVSSIDYLIGKEAARATSVTARLVRDFGRLSLKDQKVIQGMVKLMLKKS